MRETERAEGICEACAGESFEPRPPDELIETLARVYERSEARIYQELGIAPTDDEDEFDEDDELDETVIERIDQMAKEGLIYVHRGAEVESCREGFRRHPAVLALLGSESGGPPDLPPVPGRTGPWGGVDPCSSSRSSDSGDESDSAEAGDHDDEGAGCGTPQALGLASQLRRGWISKARFRLFQRVQDTRGRIGEVVAVHGSRSIRIYVVHVGVRETIEVPECDLRAIYED